MGNSLLETKRRAQAFRVTRGNAIPVDREQLRRDIIAHLESIGLTQTGIAFPQSDKTLIRAAHAKQRQQYVQRERSVLRRWLKILTPYLADGADIDPEKITPELVLVDSQDWTGALFRLATTFWSIPVSRGFGRRLRYLVMDRHNSKLIGVFALCDPVFNLEARDRWIGWSARERTERLVNVMDAYVVGAVPPYSALLGGKLVAALIGSDQVSRDFQRKYASSRGIISGRVKNAQLVLVTMTSALGRSSLYNRLRLRSAPNPFDIRSPILVDVQRVGQTRGYGHFHLDGDIFDRLRRVVQEEGHVYANGHSFGDGPNWRIRVARVALRTIGLDPNLVRHGIIREVYVLPLAQNTRDFLCGRTDIVEMSRPSVADISMAALQRWIIPRAARTSSYREVRKADYLAHLS